MTWPESEREQKRAEQQADIGLISQSAANLMRLEAQVERARAAVGDSDDWEAVRDAEREVHLARAATLELQANYLEKWGIRAFNRDLQGAPDGPQVQLLV